MSMTATETPQHPLLQFTAALHRALDKAPACEPVFMSVREKKEALVDLQRAEQRLSALRLRMLAVAGDVAEETGARSAGAWLAHETRAERSVLQGDELLARALDARWQRLGAAYVAGGVNTTQATVIPHALGELPGDLARDAVVSRRALRALLNHR